MLKYHILRIHNDDLLKLFKDEEYIDKIISQGFDDIFNTKKKNRKHSARSKSVRRKVRHKKAKNEEEDFERQNSKEQIIANTLEMIDKKLYGLIVPLSGNFLPEFFDMLKLMTLKDDISTYDGASPDQL